MFAFALILAPLAAPPVRTALEGEWRTTCQPIGKNGRHGMVGTMTVRGKAIVVRLQVYAHSNCDSPTVRAEVRNVLVRIEPAEGGFAFDYDLETAE